MKTIAKVALRILSLVWLAGCVTSVDASLPYPQLSEITVATEVKLVASPAHPTAYLSAAALAAGEKVQAIGTDKDAAWLLVLHDNIFGWMPTVFSKTNIATLKPAIVIEPLADNCTEYLDAVAAPDEAWESNTAGAVIVVGSIYRPQTGKQFDDAALAIQIEGSGTVIDSDYMHTPLTATSAVILFAYSVTHLQKGDPISFAVSNPSNEPLSFQAAFFRNNCPQDLVRLPIGKTRVVVAEQVATPTGNAPAPTQQAPTFTPTPVIVKPDPQQTTACIQPPEGLVSWWPGDGNANDVIGVNYGKLVGGATFATGKVGQAFKLNGIDGFVLINSQVYSLAGGTVELWFRKEGAVPYNTIIGSWGGSGNQRAPVLLVPGDSLWWEFGELFGEQNNTGKAINMNQWYHVAMTYDSSFNAKVYLNGELVDAKTSRHPGDFFDQIHIGHFANLSKPEFFPGLIDEVAIYNRPLNPREIQSIYNADSEGMCKPGTSTKLAPTPTPTAPPMTDTLPGTILEEGQTWRQGGVEITLENIDLTINAINFNLAFTNHKPQDIFVKYSLNSINVSDNLGRRYREPGQEIGYNCGGFSWNMENTIPVPRGETVTLNPGHCKAIYAMVDLGDPNITEITITVSAVSSINEARWRIPIYH